MRFTFISAILLSATVVSACATPVPLIVTNELPLPSTKIAAACSAKNTVVNADLKIGARSFGGDIFLTKSSQPTFPELIKSDLDELCVNGFDSARKERAVRISITSASMYYKRDAADSVPFVGMATAFNKRPVVAEAEFFFEFEEGGLVQRTRSFSYAVEIKHSVATQSDVGLAMVAAAEQFRSEAFPEIYTEVLSRYAWAD